jgi:hypothetical protein
LALLKGNPVDKYNESYLGWGNDFLVTCVIGGEVDDEFHHKTKM